MKYLIAAAAVGLILFINSCTCDHWFNNGCRFSETALGSIFKGE